MDFAANHKWIERMSVFRNLCVLLLLMSLSACGGSSPFIAGDDADTTTDGGGDDGTDPATGVGGDDDLPPGTTNPSPDRSIVRFEPTEEDGGEVGDGFATVFNYDAENDEFEVDNLAFDGANVYRRVVFVGDPADPTDDSDLIGAARVYASDGTFTDEFGDPDATIGQFQHRLLYGFSEDGKVRYAIVRTGQYVEYGFGGFLYERRGGVTLPTSGQAGYTGTYSALRDFSGRGGLEYASGDMTMAIDFEDFNDGDAVQGQVFNRRIFDINGNDITNDIVNEINGDEIPTLVFTVGPGVLTSSGEISGQVGSNIVNDDGTLIGFETGNYYAILEGDNAENVVGIIVSTHIDPRAGGATVRETGGFTLERGGG